MIDWIVANEDPVQAVILLHGPGKIYEHSTCCTRKKASQCEFVIVISYLYCISNSSKQSRWESRAETLEADGPSPSGIYNGYG